MHFELKRGMTHTRVGDIAKDYWPWKRDILREMVLNYCIERHTYST